MNLRQQAAADFKGIVEDAAGGFGWEVTITNPSGRSLAAVGLTSDVHMLIDPETGQAVSGRKAHVSLVLKTLLDAGLGTPSGKSDGEPWLVRFADIVGKSRTFKVTECMPDRAIGGVVCTLETYATEPL